MAVGDAFPHRRGKNPLAAGAGAPENLWLRWGALAQASTKAQIPSWSLGCARCTEALGSPTTARTSPSTPSSATETQQGGKTSLLHPPGPPVWAWGWRCLASIPAHSMGWDAGAQPLLTSCDHKAKCPSSLQSIPAAPEQTVLPPAPLGQPQVPHLGFSFKCSWSFYQPDVKLVCVHSPHLQHQTPPAPLAPFFPHL